MVPRTTVTIEDRSGQTGQCEPVRRIPSSIPTKDEDDGILLFPFTIEEGPTTVLKGRKDDECG